MIVGPLPEPIQGETVAIQTLVESELLNDNYIPTTINTSMGRRSGQVGKWTFGKVLRDFKVRKKIKKEFKKRKYEIFYISLSQSRFGLLRDLSFINFASKKAKKIVTHLHGNNLGNIISRMSGFEKIWVNTIFKKIDIGIVLGSQLSGNYCGLVKDIRVVPNGIQDRFQDKDILSKDKQRSNNEMKIVYLSNLIKEKGFFNLIQATLNLLKSNYRINLKLAGAIYDRNEYENSIKLIKESGYEDKIKFLGTVRGKDKDNLLLESDLMVLPSNYKVEGLPLSILEGMSAALPIISTNRGCIPDLIKGNGILMKNGSVDNVEESIKRIYDDNEKIPAMEATSRKLYLEKYTQDKYIENLIEVFLSSKNKRYSRGNKGEY
ncbi:glycosyltransferase involved in cell wall biosynthesis [Pullulanibacillus pueri]|nr:glycosyltransferase family 4 protein [Pullulanibacillus pueri]MBM7681779.1 glycosyltransferase involved in cell wall biosynthesis [Pullulanibacillus pueri]